MIIVLHVSEYTLCQVCLCVRWREWCSSVPTVGHINVNTVTLLWKNVFHS